MLTIMDKATQEENLSELLQTYKKQVEIAVT